MSAGALVNMATQPREDEMHHEHGTPEDGAQETLRRVEAGGRHLLTITRRRIGEVLDALDAGDFRQAQVSLNDAIGVIAPLASAQTHIAVAGDAELIETRFLKVGMVIVDVGTVGSVEVEECDALRCDGHVKVKVGEHEMVFGAAQEVYVSHDGE